MSCRRGIGILKGRETDRNSDTISSESTRSPTRRCPLKTSTKRSLKASMKSPTFIIIGAEKAGTTGLYHYLKAHPAVYMSPNKEPRFFSYDATSSPESEKQRSETVKSLDEYEALFAGVWHETAIGEASPIYLHSPIAAERIHEHNPDVRIIAILRHPVDRAFSHYMMMLNAGAVPYRSFDDYFRERVLRNPDWTKEPLGAYGCAISLYYENLKRFYERFERSRILTLKYDDFANEAESCCREIFDFIDVDTSFRPDTSRRHNVGGGLPRSERLHRFLVRPSLVKSMAGKLIPNPVKRKLGLHIRAINSSKATLDPNDRAEFMQVYHDDVSETQALTGLDLSDWLHT